MTTKHATKPTINLEAIGASLMEAGWKMGTLDRFRFNHRQITLSPAPAIEISERVFMSAKVTEVVVSTNILDPIWQEALRIIAQHTPEVPA